MNRNTTIGLIAVVILAILAFILFVVPNMKNGAVNEVNEEESTEMEEEDADVAEDTESTAGWQTYTNEAFNFSISHRTDAEVSVEGPDQNIVKFLYTGPDSTPNTELNDAYALTVAVVDMPGDVTLEAFANAQFQESTPPGEAVEGVTPVSFGAVPAYRYRINPIGVLTTVYVLEHPQEGKAYSIAFAIADSEGSDYGEDIGRMLSSFRISTNF